MSEDKSKKTEQPSKRKIDDARKKGQVGKAKEVVSTATILFASLYFYFFWEQHIEYLKEIVIAPSKYYDLEFTYAAKKGLIELPWLGLKYIVLPLTILISFIVILFNIVQFGFIFSFHPIIPTMDKIKPLSALERIFSIKNFGDTLLSLIKVIAITCIAIFVIYATLEGLPRSTQNCDLNCYLTLFQKTVLKLMLLIIPVFILISVFDFFLQKYQFIKDQKMTKEEAKQDFKNSFGNPLFKSFRRSSHSELINDDLGERMKNARLVITDYNSSVALAYDPLTMQLPLILGKGKGVMQTKMISIAREENVLVVEDAYVAKSLWDEGKIDQYIPLESIEEVANLMRENHLIS